MTNTVSTPVNVNEILDALEKFIKSRPGLDPANYGTHWSAYRSELRSIANDRKRALKVLDEARALNPHKPELLIDAFRAFSGRLTWNPKIEPCDWCPTGSPAHLDYCTGQYYPTEYRKAAASVLELYVSSWQQWFSRENPQKFVYRTIEDVKAANRSIGNHWFDRSTLRFFNCKIESGLIGGRYFITSERMELTMPKRYSVRIAKDDGTINTLGEFQQYYSIEDAREAIKKEMKNNV
jgi:hypothetical protein